MMNHAMSSHSAARNNGPKVTIGLPVYNGERYLREALDSLVSQDCRELEIIVSDNGSTDRTAAILAEYAAQYSALRVITQTQTLPATDNFTFLLKQAAGEYFCWAAADDLRAPGSIGKLAAVLDAHPDIVCAMTDVVDLWQDSKKRGVQHLEEIRLENVLADWPKVRRLFFKVPTSNIFFCVYGLYRTDALRHVRINLDLGFSANTEIPMLAQVALLGGIASIAEEGFVYRRHADSIYHKEVANEGHHEPFRRRKVLRWVVGGIVLRSDLPLREKAVIIRSIWHDHWIDMIGKSKRQRETAAKLLLTDNRKPLRIPDLAMRVKRRLRRLLFGLPPTATKTPPQKPQSSPSPEEVLVLTPTNLANPDLQQLVRREEARMHLEKHGWKFEQIKRIRLLHENGIRAVIDCGANKGQFVENLAKAGWSGEVFSFEPLQSEYAALAEKAVKVPGWRTFPYALGSSNVEAEIGVAGNSYSSSLLPFTRSFTELRPDASPVRYESIRVQRLDDVIREEGLAIDGPILLKLDVQGYELNVLRGAENFLKRVRLIQTEMALIPSYENSPDFFEVKKFLNERGFVLVHLIEGHSNHLTGEIREVDGIFANTALQVGVRQS